MTLQSLTLALKYTQFYLFRAFKNVQQYLQTSYRSEFYRAFPSISDEYTCELSFRECIIFVTKLEYYSWFTLSLFSMLAKKDALVPLWTIVEPKMSFSFKKGLIFWFSWLEDLLISRNISLSDLSSSWYC